MEEWECGGENKKRISCFSYMIDSKIKSLRIETRKNSQKIIEFIKDNLIYQTKIKDIKDICYFCGSHEKLTKEHVMPIWTFR